MIRISRVRRGTSLAAAGGILVLCAAASATTFAPVAVTVTGELREWHKVTLTLDGPHADESDATPNPFRDFRMTVTFAHETGVPTYQVPGYFAADGRAASTSATAGNKWRAHLSPDKAGRWTWRVTFISGRDTAVDPAAAGDGVPLAPFDGVAGSFEVAPTNKSRPDFRAVGRLQYAGAHHLRFAGSGDYFLKFGADSPETLLAYADFDGTSATRADVPLKSYQPHLADWTPGDPVWKEGKGKGLIGALNYLASEGVNAVSFLTYNAGGDGDNVWPFVARDDKNHYDVSKLDQWQIVFDHAQRMGIHLHFKLQETENDDSVRGNPASDARPAADAAPAHPVVESLDNGELGPERTLYFRELIARFGYLLALNWNLGEENTQTPEQQRAMGAYFRRADPYGHNRVLHTHPDAQEQVYRPLLGEASPLTGVSVQTSWDAVHERTVRWLAASRHAGRPWVVANDEQGPPGLGVPPDDGYAGYGGRDTRGREVHTRHDIRRMTLWGNLMAGGAGVEYYFGYELPDNDLLAENFRSRDATWDYGRIALAFFRDERIPFWHMTSADDLVGNPAHDNTRWCLASPRQLYLVYLPSGGDADLDLTGVEGRFAVAWFDPRNGGAPRPGSTPSVTGGGKVSLGMPPTDVGEDWLAVVRRRASSEDAQ